MTSSVVNWVDISEPQLAYIFSKYIREYLFPIFFKLKLRKMLLFLMFNLNNRFKA